MMLFSIFPYIEIPCHVNTLCRVVRKEQEACVMAAMSFSGLPLDFQVSMQSTA